ncbi:MAG: hypothetical protein ACR2IP_01020 [Solirubrobacteraceae bacterium]
MGASPRGRVGHTNLELGLWFVLRDALRAGRVFPPDRAPLRRPGRQAGLERQAGEEMPDVGGGDLRALEGAEDVPAAGQTELAPSARAGSTPGSAP